MNTKRTSHLVPATAALALALVAVTGGPALADSGGGHSIVRADLVGSMPFPASPVIAHVNPGGAPWVNGPSTVRVRRDGRIDVSIMGLVIPVAPFNNTNPVAKVVATLVCDDMVVTPSTMPFDLSSAGDGSTSDRIKVPSHCDDPAVLIQPAGNRTVYIASAMGVDDDDD